MQLVRDRKKITLSEAAKVLGMPQKIVEEWAEFLDDEKIISIQYRFATAILYDKKTDEKEAKQQKKEFKDKKDGLLRQVESTRSYLETQVEKINSFKVDLEQIKSDIEREFGSDSHEFKKLQKYEELKAGIIQDMEKQKGILSQRILELDQKIKREESKYQQLLKQINIGKSMIAKEKSDEVEVEGMQKEVETRLKKLSESIDHIHKDIEYERKVHSIQDKMKGFIDKLKSKYGEIKADRIEKDKNKYYAALGDHSKLDLFNKLVVEIRSSILKKDINETEELYMELRSCYNSIHNSNISQDMKAQYYHKLYDTYTQLNNLYKEKSYEKNKQDIQSKLNESENRIGEIRKNYENIKNVVSDQKRSRGINREYIKKFNDYIEKIGSDMTKTKKTLDKLYEQKTAIDKESSGIESTVMKRVLEKRGKFDDKMTGSQSVAAYQKLFEKKNDLERMIQKINADKESLENELKVLIKKAKALEISQAEDKEHEIQEVQTLMNDINIRKKEFEMEVNNFNDAIKGG